VTDSNPRGQEISEDVKVNPVGGPLETPKLPQLERLDFLALYKDKIQDLEKIFDQEMIAACDRNGRLRGSGRNSMESDLFMDLLNQAGSFRHGKIWYFLEEVNVS